MIPSDLTNTIQALKVAGIVCKGHFIAKKKSHIPIIPSKLLQLLINMTFIKELRRLNRRINLNSRPTWATDLQPFIKVRGVLPEDLSLVPTMGMRQLPITCSSNYREPTTSKGRQSSHPIETDTGIHPASVCPAIFKDNSTQYTSNQKAYITDSISLKVSEK